ncbi:MAG: MBL fold metallo-hydrolase [Opitutales bacterium]
MKAALWAARNETFASEADVDAFIDALPHSNRGTYKANTSCVQIEAGTDEALLCDAGSGIRDYALYLGPNPDPATYHIFISHLHWDHIQGFPFFTPAFQRGNRIIFHGFHQEIETAIRSQMDPPCFPVPFEHMQADIEFDVQPDGTQFQIGPVAVKTAKQQHPGDSWGYRFEKNGKSIVYSSDSEHGPEAMKDDYPFLDFLRNADVLLVDGQYTLEEAENSKRYWGHSNAVIAVELAVRAKVRQLIVFHHEPAYSDSDIEKIEKEALQRRDVVQNHLRPGATDRIPEHIAFAYDGLTIEA